MATLAIVMIIVFILLPLFYTFAKTNTSLNLPPGPCPLPIIGNFHLLGQSPHRALAKLSQKYGPIMSLRFGKVPTIVVSSPQWAQLVLKKHDNVFASKPTIEAWLYGSKAMVFTPYGDYLRRVRMMCTKHLLSAAKIAEFEELREGQMLVAMRQLAKVAMVDEVVNVSSFVGELVENMVFGIIIGKSNEGKVDLKGVIAESAHLAGQFNLADFVPFLRPLDLQGINQRMKSLRKKADKIFDSIIEDHLKFENSKNFNDILGTMLALTKENASFSSIGHENVKGIMFEIFSGGIDTTFSLITWALSSLLKNPRTMKTLQREMDTVTRKERIIKESDLSKLSYLDMVVKETVRLYPVTPFLIPHESMKDIVIEGYTIPNKSRVIVNTWAIGHDPLVWSSNVEEFFPERFIDNNVDVYGHHFEFLPFGGGRRICPGLKLGLVIVKLILAQLVHCFDWEHPNCIDPSELDMTENFGLTMPRANPLLVIPSMRLQVSFEEKR